MKIITDDHVFALFLKRLIIHDYNFIESSTLNWYLQVDHTYSIYENIYYIKTETKKNKKIFKIHKENIIIKLTGLLIYNQLYSEIINYSKLKELFKHK